MSNKYDTNADAFETVLDELKEYDIPSVADAAGVHQSTLYNWLEGRYKPHYTTLIKVARALDFDVVVNVVKQ